MSTCLADSLSSPFGLVFALKTIYINTYMYVQPQVVGQAVQEHPEQT